MRVHIRMKIGLRRRLGYNLLFYKFAGVQETVRKSYSVIVGSDCNHHYYNHYPHQPPRDSLLHYLLVLLLGVVCAG